MNWVRNLQIYSYFQRATSEMQKSGCPGREIDDLAGGGGEKASPRRVRYISSDSGCEVTEVIRGCGWLVSSEIIADGNKLMMIKMLIMMTNDDDK